MKFNGRKKNHPRPNFLMASATSRVFESPNQSNSRMVLAKRSSSRLWLSFHFLLSCQLQLKTDNPFEVLLDHVDWKGIHPQQMLGTGFKVIHQMIEAFTRFRPGR